MAVNRRGRDQTSRLKHAELAFRGTIAERHEKTRPTPKAGSRGRHGSATGRKSSLFSVLSLVGEGDYTCPVVASLS